jgi:hypothetical protein
MAFHNDTAAVFDQAIGRMVNHSMRAPEYTDTHRAEEAAAEEICEAFDLIGTAIPLKRLAVIAPTDNGYKVGLRSMSEVVLEAIHDMRVDAELLKIIEDSPCELVKRLRERICEDYVERNARDVAEARA